MECVFLCIENFQSASVSAQDPRGTFPLTKLATTLGTTPLLFLVWVCSSQSGLSCLFACCCCVVCSCRNLNCKFGQFLRNVFYFFLKSFIYIVFLSYRSIYTHVSLSEPAYTQVSLVIVACTRILHIIAGAYIT